MTTVCPQLRVVHALAGGALLAHRPGRDTVLHVVDGTLTPSGRWVSRGGRTVTCGRGSLGRLEIVQGHPPALDLRGRRFCRCCIAASSTTWSRVRLVSRDDFAAVFAGLTLELLLQAAVWTGRRDGASPEEWAAAVEETHQIGCVASVALGYQASAPVEDVLIPRRNRFRTRALTEPERAANVRAREAETDEHARIMAARATAERYDRAIDRRNRHAYQLPWDRVPSSA